ncbi:unnamed protein product (mitochondrion) [Plasmodiophora brassicae]|uniref:PPPDE domain-containing protein n=1 Tax=Plasmodiophora brassicae TaxID=37360 RepID=A0A0G4IWJ0_PLABS|nr:hypothetical protein PBRA_001362 [Plasmodiophora brassicae]SPQ97463.1 unnamed protein product [Plasmodiophora brassicae]
MVRVQLYLYDLSQGMARQMSPMLLGREIEGIWHSGVVVYDREYFYGGGIQSARPGMTVAGRPLRIIDLGETSVPPDLLNEFLREVSHRFTPETYNLFRHNCNTFANELSLFLTGSPIPSYITGLPDEVLSTPMGASLIPLIEGFERSLRAEGGGNGFVPWQESQQASVAPVAQPSGGAGPKSPVAAAPTSPVTAAEPTDSCPVRPDPFPNKHLQHINTGSAPLTSVDKNASTFLTQITPLLREPEKAAMAKLVAALNDGSQGPPPDCIAIFARLITETPAKKAFSVLALFRLAMHVRPLAEVVLKRNQGLILQMLERTMSEASDAPMSVQIMALCALSNVLAHGSVSHDLALNPHIIEYATRAVRSKMNPVRMMGATVMYNCALQLHYDSADAQDRDDVSVQMISALHEALVTESDGPSRYRMLLALGHLVFFMGHEGVMLLSALEFNADAFREPANAAAVAQDIQALLADNDG